MIRDFGGQYENEITKSRSKLLVYGNYTINKEQYTCYQKALKYNIECISEDELYDRINKYIPKPSQGSLF